ncbi:MAG: FtsX-like permease family protein [Candidatus Latescibacteria bacterium]|nr:FtsX-like permease family protein [Candidatus Latescibacterota bacterium]NIO56247.1 FtsX-like permease family protein [Candidatus Latescibacterota bacterium]
MHALLAFIVAGILWFSREFHITKTQLKKVVSDLMTRPGRTALVIVALIIGLWGVGSIIVSIVILQNDLSQNFLQTRPAHAIMTSKNFDRLDMTAFRERADIESAELRDFSMQRIEVAPNEWIPVWLFGVEDFQNFSMAQIYHVSGDSVPASGSILIERECRTISNLDYGTVANLRVGGRRLKVPVSGVCFDPAQAPATQDHFVYAYADKKTYSQITGQPANQRLIVRVRDARSRKDVQVAADKMMAYFESMGISVTKLEVPKFNEHPHQWQLNTLLFLQGAIGFLAFLMGAVVVSQLMAAILSQQIRQIGVLKAIGASRRQILRMYITMVLVFGIVAGAVAIPLAVWSGFAFSDFVATKINFEVLTSRLPIQVYVYLAITSVMLPVLLSLPALLRGINAPVQQALGDYGIGQNGRVKSDKMVSMPRLSSTLTMAVRNVGRRKKRLALTVIAMALGVAIFAAGFNVRRSLAVLLSDVRDGLRYDAQVVFGDQIPRDRALLPFRDLKNVSRVEAWNGGKGEVESRLVSAADGVGIVALPYNTDLFRLRIVEGRWLQRSGETEVVMNRRALEFYRDLKVGGFQTLIVDRNQIRVKLVGIMDEFDKAKIYIDKDRYDALANPDHLVNSLMFVARDRGPGQVMALKHDIENAIASSDLNVLYVMLPAERTQIIYDHLNIILLILLFLAFLVLLVSALGMASATGINIMERTREIGVLRAIGATPKTIYNLFVTEGFVISVAGIALGLILALPLSMLASPFFGRLMLGDGGALRFAWSPTGSMITLIATLLFGWLASRIPAGSAMKVSTREALAYE